VVEGGGVRKGFVDGIVVVFLLLGASWLVLG
jgi:hypothetical protein